jgi:hypothetical protein
VGQVEVTISAVPMQTRFRKATAEIDPYASLGRVSVIQPNRADLVVKSLKAGRFYEDVKGIRNDGVGGSSPLSAPTFSSSYRYFREDRSRRRYGGQSLDKHAFCIGRL